jgi:NADH-quinone oxidoreductase subunit L
MHHEQDIRNMGGLARKIPFTAAMMLIGTLALTGFPLTAGFYSKDAIIEAAYASPRAGHVYAFLCVLIAAFCTSFYSWRLFFMTFMGQPRRAGHGHDDHAADGHGQDSHGQDAHGQNAHGHGSHEPHESPLVMLVPLGILAAGALFAGILFKNAFFGAGALAFWKGSLVHDPKLVDAIHHVPGWVVAAPFVAMVLGFALAWLMYIRRPHMPAELAARHRLIYEFFLNKWYFDELYDRIFVRPAMWLGRFLWKRGDGWLIDGFGPDGVSARVIDVTNRVVRLQTGYVYHYAFAMLVGVAALVTWYMLGAR